MDSGLAGASAPASSKPAYTGNVLFECENQSAFVNSAKRWFVRFRVEVWDLAATGDGTGWPVLIRDYDAGGQEVLIHFPVGTFDHHDFL